MRPKVVVALALGSVVMLKLLSKIRSFSQRKKKIAAMRAESQAQAERKRRERAQTIENINLPEVPEAVYQALDNASILEIQGDFEAKRYTSEQLVAGAISRTIDIGVKLNLISDVNFEWALRRARECD